MAGFDAAQVSALLRKIGANDDLLANAYVFGSISGDSQEQKTIASLHKAGLLRPDDEAGEFRVTSDFKRMLNRLMRKQSSYRQLTDMGKVIDALDETVKDYQLAIQAKQHEDAELFLEQLDDLLYETKDGLNTNLDRMHYGIVSQFGFVNSLANKIRQNERYLNHAQNLLTELQQIDPEACYEWINWPCPNEFARKITGFVYWFNQVLPRLRFIIDNMRLSLFRLRRDEKKASQLRSMARFLRQHPEFELSDNLHQDGELPEALKLAAKMPLSCYIETHNTEHEAALVSIVQSLRKQAVSAPVAEREVLEVTLTPVEKVSYETDFFDMQTESLFERVIDEDRPISAVDFWRESQASWQAERQSIHPKAWIELVFSCYCKLTNDQQAAFHIEMKGAILPGTSANYTYSDVVISLN